MAASKVARRRNLVNMTTALNDLTVGMQERSSQGSADVLYMIVARISSVEVPARVSGLCEPATSKMSGTRWSSHARKHLFNCGLTFPLL